MDQHVVLNQRSFHGTQRIFKSKNLPFSCKRGMTMDAYPACLPNAKLEDTLDLFRTDLLDSSCTKNGAVGKKPHRMSPEAEAGGWLRDEPGDGAIGNGFHVPNSVPDTGRDGGGGTEGNPDDGGLFFPDILKSTEDLTRDTGVSPDFNWANLPSYTRLPCPSGFAAIMRATKIKETTVHQAIQSCGGGLQGFKLFTAMVMYWVDHKNRSNIRALESSNCQPVSLSPDSEEIDPLSFSSAGSECTVETALWSAPDCAKTADNISRFWDGGSNPEIESLPALGDGSESLTDLSVGGDSAVDYNNVLGCEDQPHMFIGERGSLGRMVVDRVNVQGLASPGSGPLPPDDSPMPPSAWFPTVLQVERTAIRKLSPSPDRSERRESDIPTPYNLREKKAKLSSPSRTNNSSHGSNGLRQAYRNSAISLSDGSTPPGMFGSAAENPFSYGYSSYGPGPGSPHSAMDTTYDWSTISSYGLYGQTLKDENVTLCSSAQGCGMFDRVGPSGGAHPVSPDNSRHRDNTDYRLHGELSRVRANPATTTRLARKNRMDRNNRKGHQAARGAASQSGASSAGANSWTGRSAPRSLATASRSEFFPSPEAKVKVTKDRRDQDDLQFLLQKILRPSDVGNLGRIVLPKKDAEAHLPWLGAREGVPFACEDYDTGEKMMLRYRFWPNNKSRMYLLENTGDFVKNHRLQETDRLVIYKKEQQDAFVVRGMKAKDSETPTMWSSTVHEPEVKEVKVEVKEENSSPESAFPAVGFSIEEIKPSSPAVEPSCLEVHSRSLVTTITSLEELQEDEITSLAAYLPDDSMPQSPLVRFPSIESLDVEAMDLVSADVESENARSGRHNSGEG